VELFIIRVKFAIYYFLHFNTVRQVAARLRAKSAIYDCLVHFVIRKYFTVTFLPSTSVASITNKTVLNFIVTRHDLQTNFADHSYS